MDLHRGVRIALWFLLCLSPLCVDGGTAKRVTVSGVRSQHDRTFVCRYERATRVETCLFKWTAPRIRSGRGPEDLAVATHREPCATCRYERRLARPEL